MMKNKLQLDMQKFQDLQIVLEQDKQNNHFRNKFTSLYQVQKQILDTIKEHKLGLMFRFESVVHEDFTTTINVIVTHKECEEMLVNTVPLVLKDTTNPQALGSALTYARRYILTLTFGLCDQEVDDDGEQANGHSNQSENSQNQPQTNKKTFNYRGNN